MTTPYTDIISKLEEQELEGRPESPDVSPKGGDPMEQRLRRIVRGPTSPAFGWAHLVDEAASELSRRASRIEELEKVLACVEVRAEGVAICVPGVGVYGWVLLRDSEIAPVVSAAFNELQRAALSSQKPVADRGPGNSNNPSGEPQ